MSGLSRVPLGSSASIARFQTQSIRPVNPVLSTAYPSNPYPDYPSYPNYPVQPVYPPNPGGGSWRFSFWRGIEMTGRGLIETVAATGELIWRVAGVALRGVGVVLNALWRGVQAVFDPGYRPPRPYPGQPPY